MTNKIQMNIDALNLEAGELCLEFANTANWHASAEPIEGLNSYNNLANWAKKTGLLNNQAAEQLLQQAATHPTEAGATLAQAIDLREAIYRVFSATAKKDVPEAADLAVLNTALQQAFAHLQVTQAAQNFNWQWVGNEKSLDVILWPVARSAAELLTSDRLERVKECEDDRGCGFLFLDLSKNRSRRWCDMESCGNRAKVRRHRRRQGTVE